MKYNIHINQKAAIEHFPSLDIVDLAIFDFIKDFTNSRVCRKVVTDNGVFFMLRWRLIADQLPILNIKTSMGINKRLNKLVEAGLLIRNATNKQERNSLFKWGDNYDKMIFTATNESLPLQTMVGGTTNESLELTTNNGLDYNSITNNNNINDNEEGSQKEIEVFPTFQDFYDLYDKKVDPHLAIRAWNKISQKHREEIMEYIPRYIAAEPKKEFRRNPSVFLNNKTWQNEIINKAQAQSIVGTGVTESGTKSRLHKYANEG